MKNCSIRIINKSGIQTIKESLPHVIPLVFDQVEEMEIHTELENGLWKEFIARHSSLKVLNFLHQLSGEKFMQLMLIITGNLPNLIEMRLKWLYGVDDRMVKEFIKARTNLKKIDVDMDHQSIQEFRNNFLNSQWIVKNEPRFLYSTHKTLIRENID